MKKKPNKQKQNVFLIYFFYLILVEDKYPINENTRVGGTPNRDDTSLIDLDNDETTVKAIGKDKDNSDNSVSIMNAKNEDRTASFFAQPGILAGEFIF